MTALFAGVYTENVKQYTIRNNSTGSRARLISSFESELNDVAEMSHRLGPSVPAS